jgi:hypothetical protein
MARPVPSLPAPAEDAVETAAVDVTPVAEAAPVEPARAATTEVEADAIEAEADAIEADAEPTGEPGAKSEPSGRRRKNKGRTTANKTSRR